MTRVKVQAQPCRPHVTYCDWDKEELRPLLQREMIYTIRSSKYPRTLDNPSRVILIIDTQYAFSVHKILLKSFSKTLWSKLQTSSSSSSTSTSASSLAVSALSPPTPNALPAWQIFTDWLYTFDKIPLPDFTPLRPPSRLYTTRNMVAACLLADKLGAVKFEKWLCRIVCKEVWDGEFNVDHLTHLSQTLSPRTGLHHFSAAYLRWQSAGRPAELDPYRWRVEHWYSVCGTRWNWGCFHTMSPSGWGGVWERQRERAAEYEGDVGDLVGGSEDGSGSGSDANGSGSDGEGYEETKRYESPEGGEGSLCGSEESGSRSNSSSTSEEQPWEDEYGYEYLRGDEPSSGSDFDELDIGLNLLEEGQRGYLTPEEG